MIFTNLCPLHLSLTRLICLGAVCWFGCEEGMHPLSVNPDAGEKDLTPLDAASRIEDLSIDQRVLILPDTSDNLFVQYIQAVFEAELRTGYTPRQMLALLRQLYYGESWSVIASDPRWMIVIPCSPKLGDPRSTLGDELFARLGGMAEISGVDMGHVFAGLETMVCPSATVITVAMSNEEFATWGGDLGAAVAAHSACPALGPAAKSKSDCGYTDGVLSWAEYLAIQAPPQDLEGDLDPFAIRAALMQVECAASLMQPLLVEQPLSEILLDYYLRPSTALGTLHGQRNQCVIEALDGRVQNKLIANKELVAAPIAERLVSFAQTYFYTLLGRSPAEDELAEIQATSIMAATGFLEALEQGI